MSLAVQQDMWICGCLLCKTVEFQLNYYTMTVVVLNILAGQAGVAQQQQQVEVACEDDASATGDNIAFTVLSKKGNKQQVILVSFAMFHTYR